VPLTLEGFFTIPVTVDDLVANGLLGEAERPVCWERSLETLTARKSDVGGLAVATEKRIEAYLLHAPDGDVLSLHSAVEGGGALLRGPLSRPRAGGVPTFRFPKVHAAEIAKDFLATLNFREAGTHRLYAARARSG
jgi:hypothetical protein